MNTKKYLTQKHYVILIALICSILWGSAFPVLKISYSELKISPSNLNAKVVLAGMRFLIAGLILFILTPIFMKRSIKINKNELKNLSLLGLVQTALQYFFFYNGLGKTSGMKGAILSSIGNFFVVIMAHFIYSNDKINKRKTIGLISGFAGIIVVNMGGSNFNLDFSFTGEGFLIISSIMGAFAIIIAKELSKDIHPFIASAWQLFIGSLILLAAGSYNLQPNSFNFTFKGWVLLIYSSLISAIAFSLWYALLKYNKAGEITIYRFVIPISGALLSAIFIPGEKFSINLLFGLLLVVIGIFSINYNSAYFTKWGENRFTKKGI